jgi:hypothetical protein
LTLQAGRSVTLNAGITTGGANLVVVTNDAAANGAYRDAGVGAFVNNAGAGALSTGGGRWLVYSVDPASDTFSGLTSGQLPLWGKTYTSYPTVAETGNRYLFSTVPSLSASVIGGNIVKTYGTAIATPIFGITGLVDAALYGNVFTQESYVSSLAAISNGFAANAPVVGSPYAVTYGGALSAPTGYGLNAYGTESVTVTPLTVATWRGGTSGLWSTASNWDVLPSGGNVQSVAFAPGTSVTYDAAAGSTSLQSVSGIELFTLQGGSFNVAGSFVTPNYAQTGGALTGTGALTVTNSFSQTAGSIAMTGPVSITQAAGPLTVGKITAPSITLQASTGAIDQRISTDPANPNGLTGVVSLRTTGGASLTDTANRLSGFAVADVILPGSTVRSSGNIALTNGAALDVSGISLASGNLSVENTGSVSNSGVINVDGGNFEIKSHSPITVGNTVTASGNITLAAVTQDGTSNITLNGSMTSTAGGISIQAYNNFIQNSRLSAALGIDVKTIFGSLTFGPGAYSVGNPVTYSVNGVSYMPPWIASTLSGGATDFVVAFLDQFQAVLDAQQVASIDDPLGLLQRGQEGIVVEGEICKP